MVLSKYNRERMPTLQIYCNLVSSYKPGFPMIIALINYDIIDIIDHTKNRYYKR